MGHVDQRLEIDQCRTVYKNYAKLLHMRTGMLLILLSSRSRKRRPMSPAIAVPAPVKRGRGRPPLPIILHPEPPWPDTVDPADFADALSAQMKRHGDTAQRLHRAVKS